MTECECLGGCPFFNDKMKNYPTAVKSLKNRLCLGNNEECARYNIFKRLGKEKVPSDLYPHQTDRIEDILRTNK